MRVLVVEDEARIADFVSRGLTEQGYAVDVATDGEESLQWSDVASFDLVVLDVMLPRLSGMDVCQTLRDRGFQAPILMLTARDGVEDRVRGLDSGADDYLVKPFAFAELLARLRALTPQAPTGPDNRSGRRQPEIRYNRAGGLAGRRLIRAYVQGTRPSRVPDASQGPCPDPDDDRRACLEL